MTLATLKRLCHESRGTVSWRDTWIATTILLGGAFGFSELGSWLRDHGRPVAAELAMMMAFPGTFVLAMPFLWLKGRPWRAQVAIVAAQLALLLLLIAWIAARI